MAMIFDRFPNEQQATAFVEAVAQRYRRKAKVFESQEDMQARFDDLLSGKLKGDHEADVFPFELDPPIVLVSRMGDDDEECDIETLVADFNGRFAGT